MSFGLALSGGGTKGAAHIGVLLALAEHQYYPTSIAGTSAGGIAAGLYAAGYEPHELKKLVIALSEKGYRLIDVDYWGLLLAAIQFLTYRPVQFSGFIKGNRLEQYLAGLTSKSIEDVKIKTVIPAVDLNSGNTIVYTNNLATVTCIENIAWRNDALLSEIMRASAAIPVIFKPKLLDTLCLVDGGVTDVLPVDLLIAAGERNVLAVDLAEDYESHHDHNIMDIASHSLSIMSRRLRSCTSNGERLLLHPKLPEGAGVLTFHHMVACMDAGYEATISSMDIIKKLFE